MSLHSKLAMFRGPKEQAELLRLRNLPNYSRIMASLNDLTDIEILALNKALKKLMHDKALPDEYDMMAEAINMSIIPRIKNLT